MTRVNENLVEEHKKVKELVDMVNEHSRLLEEYRKIWTENFDNLARKVNEQSAAILALRDMVLPAVEN
jgi:hemerythrin-like domain-containing protein